MKSYLTLLLLLMIIQGTNAQDKGSASQPAKVTVYYFHPDERCPIDEAIEKNTKKVVQTDFAAELKSGKVKLMVVNTDDKANASLASKFDINTQALYIVGSTKGKETRIDMTTFAFDYGKSDPVKFMVRLKDEILKAIKQQ
jgi:hypothetical protein